MIQGRYLASLLCCCPFLFFLLPVAASQTQTVSAPARPAASDVVMMSLETLNPRAELRRHVRDGLVGPADEENKKAKALLEVQMSIVRATAKFGPVLLLAPDEATKSALGQRCQDFQICNLLGSDQVRIKVVLHDSVWIRDFGPQIEARGDSAYVVHWRYYDFRAEEAKREKLQELETARLKLLETRQQEVQPDALTHESNPDAHKAAIAAIDDRIFLLREYSQILSDASPQRINDDNSAFDIADAVLAAPDFNYKRSGVSLDGGNLLKLEDGRCLTTRALFSRNKDQNINLDQELANVGGCKDVTYLEPLPGPVIEHVDMFALPVDGKRILLATYDLTEPFATKHWGQLTSAERDLALDAGLAMEVNAERLRHLGYEVIRVPSPFPRIPPDGRTYYPSMLNALVRTATDGSRQVLLPSYKDDEPDIQSSAVRQIAATFGPRTEIITIEATAAAKAQGAVHCLTLTAPLPLSIFGDSEDQARRDKFLVRKEQLDRNPGGQIASQIPPTGLQGSWAILRDVERGDETPLELYPQRIFFDAHEFQKGVFSQLEAKGTYIIDSRGPAAWTLHFLFPDHEAMSAVVQWMSKDEVKLILENGDTPLVLKRIGSETVSPFKSEQQDSPDIRPRVAGPRPSTSYP